MKFNFKKISAVAASVLIGGLTIGAASAASFPAPFVEDGKADVAVVYGANANLDMAAAGNVQTALGTYVEGTTVSVEGGESFMLEKTSNKFNFNNALNAVYSDLDEEEMDFLADGTYDDGDVDEEYEQKITLGTKALTLFADNDYNSDEPTVGFKWDNGETILSYTIDFDEVVNYTEMVDTDMPLFGKNYYVLAASSTQIDILDSAEKTVIAEGESVTVAGKTVSIEFIDSDEVKFLVDGESTDKLQDHEYEELSDGSYIVANEILYSTKEGTVGKAEFSIGAGKMELISGSEVELNDEDVDGLETTITDNTGMDSLTLTWKSDRETFLAEGDPIVMPGFGAIQLVFNGLDMPSDSETISFDNGDTLTLNMENYDLPLMWWNGTDAFLGEEDYELIVATSTATNTTWTSPARTANLTGGLDLEENDRFLVTNIGTDLTDVETMYYEVTTIENDSGTILVELEDLIGNNDLTFDELESKDRGVITATLVGVNGSVTGARAYMNFSTSDATIYYNKAVSDKGMVLTLPTDVSSVDTSTAATVTLTEADKDDDITEGRAFTVSVKATSNDKLHASTHNLTSYDEEESDDNYIGYVPSDLASKIMFDTSADEYDFSVEYYGTEVTADVRVVGGDATVSSGDSALGDVLVKDSEINSVMSKNLVIVGGSCINSAAATVLGGAYCGEMFTQMTGVSAGEFLIKGVEDAYTSGKLALVVAGYEAADTANAVTYLTKKDVDTMKSYKGTSATEATMLVE